MSRIGKRPIEVPAGVLVSIDPGRVTVSGPKGELRQEVPQRMQIAQEEGLGKVGFITGPPTAPDASSSPTAK